MDPSNKEEIHKYLHIAYRQIGDFTRALESVEIALRAFPDDEILQRNYAHIVHEVAKRRISGQVAEYARAGAISPETEQVIGLALQSGDATRIVHKIPSVSQDAPFGNGGAGIHVRSSPEARPDLPPGKLDIAFFTGPAFEDWGPDEVDEGMGGSETMACELATRLAARGHRVRVYGQPKRVGMIRGVEWLPYQQIQGQSFDVLVASRIPQVVDDEFGIKARVRILWIHDVHCGEALTLKRSLRFDRIFCLSEWHRSFVLETYKYLDPENVVVTRNGIDLKLFEQEVPEIYEKMRDSIAPALFGNL